MKNRLKREKGITLIMLVISIIVLLIVAGVGIYLSLGNNSIANKAIEARNKTDKSAAVEKMNLKITNIQIASYIENKNLPQLQYVADKLCEDEEMEYVQVKSKTIASLGYIDTTGYESIYTKLKEYPYEFEIDNSLRLASVDGTKIIENSTDKNSIKMVSKLEETTEVSTFNYTGIEQEYVVPEDGYYKIECWGAQGGTYNNATGGNGAYTKGIINLAKGEKLYVYVGECYNGSKQTMSYNGGGSGSNGTTGKETNTNGGGATDVRLVNGNWDEFESLKSRIIVAAGGGGGYTSPNSVRDYGYSYGGYGGALIGGNGNIIKASSNTIPVNPTVGATQIQGGYDQRTQLTEKETRIGKFGKGGYGTYESTWIYYSGGGGGYYGGGTGNSGNNYSISSASGGSSYISGYEGCNSIAETSTEKNIIHTGSIIHYSGKYFLFTRMESGRDYMPSYQDTKTEVIGNSGNGYAKITKMKTE